MAAKSDYGRAVADGYRKIDEYVKGTEHPAEGPLGDRSVREQISSDVKRLIESHENRQPFPFKAES